MKVITFSKVFPSKHPKKGEETFFREKIWCGLADTMPDFQIPNHCTDWDWYEYYNGTPKLHTIRNGKRWKVGEYFSPRVWSGKPYASKQIEIAQPLQIKKIWDFEMNLISRPFFKINGEGVDTEVINLIAKNDGLSISDFKDWFTAGRPIIHAPFFSGQILCWDEKLDYA